ncbi:MAG: type II 3-dehydroquinate dehydratase [Pseudomonadota bacterium]
MPSPIHILNGPNLNTLGQREPEIYGATTLAEIEARSRQVAAELGHEIVFRQSNHEGALVDWVQEAAEASAPIVINAAALTHTSIALHDALKLCPAPVIEVHISNVYRREAFRHHSLISAVVTGLIVGLGAQGYELAIRAIAAQSERG